MLLAKPEHLRWRPRSDQVNATTPPRCVTRANLTAAVAKPLEDRPLTDLRLPTCHQQSMNNSTTASSCEPHKVGAAQASWL